MASSSTPGIRLSLPESSATPAAQRERYRDWYLTERDPIPVQRLHWRAGLFRQLVHLLPGDRILELGPGGGAFTRQLERISRGENPIATYSFDRTATDTAPPREFDHVVGYDILDSRDAPQTLRVAIDALKPGGHAVFFVTNPGNPILKARRAAGIITGRRDQRGLLSRHEVEAELAAAGFTGVFSVFTDFLYAPLSKRGSRRLHDLSAVLQNVPVLQTFSGALAVYARKPGETARNVAPLTDHASLTGKVSVVVPCHNEEMNLELLVTRLRELYDAYIHEIILVDDNSSDGTADVIRSLSESDSRVRAVFRRPPAGPGRALADGYRAATGEFVLSLDADFAGLLPEVRDLFDAVAAGADVAVGSRFSPDSVLVNYPAMKIVANRGFHLLASIVLRRHFRDLTNNLKLMRREVVSRLSLSEGGFALNAETGMGPLVLGYKVVEVPISWVGRDENMGASSFRLAAAGPGYLNVLRELRRLTPESGR